MATIGTNVSLTGRDRSHQELGVLRANFQALLARRGIDNYENFQNQLTQLNTQIQNLRAGNATDIMARGGAEIARQDMERFFNQFIARVESNPQAIHSIAQAINPDINIDNFDISPQAEFSTVESIEILNQLRSGDGPFDVINNAVTQANNTDLFVLFSLYASARAAFRSQQNPNQVHQNEQLLQGLEQQRAYLTRVNDELSGAYTTFDQQETRASQRTWASRTITTITGATAGAALALMVSGNPKTPNQVPVAPVANQAPVTVNVNLNNSIQIGGHTVAKDAQGNLILSPINSTTAATLENVNFQFENLTVAPNGKVTGKLNYALPGKKVETIDAQDGENTLSDGSKVTLKRVGDKFKVTYKDKTAAF